MARRLTQQDIARMAGVSQTTVSLVLNNRAEGAVRISPETRERVIRVIKETGYIADPAARRLAEGRNRILGVFTYEAVFPATSADFYHPFLVGIEECTEEAGCDLLLFTSARASGGRRRIFDQDSRVRLADGCVLLGHTVDRDDLARLITDQIPFVSVGRRDDAGGPVPYVGADYASAAGALVRRAVALGHRTLVYVGAGSGAESWADRHRGFLDAVTELGVEGVRVNDSADADPPPGGQGVRISTAAGLQRGAPDVDAVLATGATVAFFEEQADAVTFMAAARHRVSVPADLSVVTLGSATRPVRSDIDFTGFLIPRREMGRRSVELLTGVIESGGTPQELLPCELIEGSTLAATRPGARPRPPAS
ncbi:LacI family DNA-binding transcriptional regulator [Nonomuraea maheshkhaliensis]|uniref:LacI family DNA-binding transcriptional regulator n=1 Tax=Nonomuraea maheshkhaliensis TaxID=419590 RepID=A0ABP4R9K7_9ACTN